MTKVAILPVLTEKGVLSYQGVSSDKTFYFSAAEQQRMGELMQEWRIARDGS